MVSGKSKNGRGGSSGRSRKNNPGHQISSTSSKRPEPTSSSPSSVTRRPLPTQYPESSQAAPAIVPPPSRFSPPSNTSRHHQPSRSQSSSQRVPNQLENFQQQQPIGEMSPPVNPVNHFEDAVESADETGDDDSNDDSDEERNDFQGPAEAQMTLDALLNTKDRDLYIDRLSPLPGQGLWFTRNKNVLTNSIAKLLQEKFDGLWYSWSVTPISAQNMYFIQFAHQYTWDPRLTPQVRARFNAICVNRLKGMINYVRTRRKRPNWIRGKLWKKMVAFWDTEDAIIKSQKASKARMSDRGGLGPHKHVGGPKSNAQHQLEMSEQEGREVSFAEVFIKTHTRKDGTYVDEKAKQIGETYEKNLQAMHSELSIDVSMASDGASQANQLTRQQLDDLFLKSTTVDSRGRPYGLGSLSEGHKLQTTNSAHLSCSAITALEEKLKETQQKLAEQVEQNKAQVDFMMRYLKDKDPSLQDFVFPGNVENPLPQDDTTAN